MPRVKRNLIDLTGSLAVKDFVEQIGPSIAGLFWQRRIHDPNANTIIIKVIFQCTDGVEVTADYGVVKISSDLLKTLELTHVGTAPSRNENGDVVLKPPVKSGPCLTAVQCLYGHDIDELLRSVGFDAFPAVFQIAMYIQAINVALLLIKWTSENVDKENAIRVLRFATTVAVGQELTPDLQQQIGDLIRQAVGLIGWHAIIRDSDSDSHSAEAAEALAMLLALDLDALSNFFARTRPCTDFVRFLVLWADSQQQLADVGTLLLKLSEHEPFGEGLSLICGSAADLWQIKKFVAEKVANPGYRLVLNAVFTDFPQEYSSQQPPETPGYAPTSPAYAPRSPAYTSDLEEPQTPGYAPHDDGP